MPARPTEESIMGKLCNNDVANPVNKGADGNAEFTNEGREYFRADDIWVGP